MPNLSIKDVPGALAEKLRQRAARNHRSLQGELMAIVEAAARETAWELASPLAPRSGFTEAAARFRARYSEALPDPLGAAAIVRDMRDTHYGEAWVMARVKDGHWPAQSGDDAPLGGKIFCIYPKTAT